MMSDKIDKTKEEEELERYRLSVMKEHEKQQNSLFKKFLGSKHENYFLNHLQNLPEPYTSQDTNRITLLYFAISGLDILEPTRCASGVTDLFPRFSRDAPYGPGGEEGGG